MEKIEIKKQIDIKHNNVFFVDVQRALEEQHKKESFFNQEGQRHLGNLNCFDQKKFNGGKIITNEIMIYSDQFNIDLLKEFGKYQDSSLFERIEKSDSYLLNKDFYIQDLNIFEKNIDRTYLELLSDSDFNSTHQIIENIKKSKPHGLIEELEWLDVIKLQFKKNKKIDYFESEDKKEKLNKSILSKFHPIESLKFENKEKSEKSKKLLGNLEEDIYAEDNVLEEFKHKWIKRTLTKKMQKIIKKTDKKIEDFDFYLLPEWEFPIKSLNFSSLDDVVEKGELNVETNPFINIKQPNFQLEFKEMLEIIYKYEQIYFDINFKKPDSYKVDYENIF